MGIQVIFLLGLDILQKCCMCWNLLNLCTKSKPVIIIHLLLGYVIVVSLTNIDVDFFVFCWFTTIKDEHPVVDSDERKKLFCCSSGHINNEADTLTDDDSNMIDSNVYTNQIGTDYLGAVLITPSLCSYYSYMFIIFNVSYTGFICTSH